MKRNSRLEKSTVSSSSLVCSMDAGVTVPRPSSSWSGSRVSHPSNESSMRRWPSNFSDAIHLQTLKRLSLNVQRALAMPLSLSMTSTVASVAVTSHRVSPLDKVSLPKSTTLARLASTRLWSLPCASLNCATAHSATARSILSSSRLQAVEALSATPTRLVEAAQVSLASLDVSERLAVREVSNEA